MKETVSGCFFLEHSVYTYWCVCDCDKRRTRLQSSLV